MRKTKIVCTIGPSSESLENTKKLIGRHERSPTELLPRRFRGARQPDQEHPPSMQELGKTVAILLDTKGPEIRLGKLKEEPIELVPRRDDHVDDGRNLGRPKAHSGYIRESA